MMFTKLISRSIFCFSVLTGCSLESQFIENEQQNDSVVHDRYLWPEATIPWFFDVLKGTEGAFLGDQLSDYENKLQASMIELTINTPLVFERLSSIQDAKDNHFLRIIPAPPVFSGVAPPGRIISLEFDEELVSELVPDNVEDSPLLSDLLNSNFLIAGHHSIKHELAHSIGMMHPHQRSDHNEYVNLYPDSIDFFDQQIPMLLQAASWFTDLVQEPTQDLHSDLVKKVYSVIKEPTLRRIGPYQFTSVTSYHSWAHSKRPSANEDNICFTLLMKNELDINCIPYPDTLNESPDYYLEREDVKALLPYIILPHQKESYSKWNYTTISVLYCREGKDYERPKQNASTRCNAPVVQRHLERYDHWRVTGKEFLEGEEKDSMERRSFLEHMIEAYPDDEELLFWED